MLSESALRRDREVSSQDNPCTGECSTLGVNRRLFSQDYTVSWQTVQFFPLGAWYTSSSTSSSLDEGYWIVSPMEARCSLCSRYGSWGKPQRVGETKVRTHSNECPRSTSGVAPKERKVPYGRHRDFIVAQPKWSHSIIRRFNRR